MGINNMNNMMNNVVNMGPQQDPQMLRQLQEKDMQIQQYRTIY